MNLLVDLAVRGYLREIHQYRHVIRCSQEELHPEQSVTERSLIDLVSYVVKKEDSFHSVNEVAVFVECEEYVIKVVVVFLRLTLKVLESHVRETIDQGQSLTQTRRLTPELVLECGLFEPIH